MTEDQQKAVGCLEALLGYHCETGLLYKDVLILSHFLLQYCSQQKMNNGNTY